MAGAPTSKAWTAHGPRAYGGLPGSHILLPKPPKLPKPHVVSSGDTQNIVDRKLCPHQVVWWELMYLLSQLCKCQVSWKKTKWSWAAAASGTGRRRNPAAKVESINKKRKRWNCAGTQLWRASHFQIRAVGRVQAEYVVSWWGMFIYPVYLNCQYSSSLFVWTLLRYDWQLI